MNQNKKMGWMYLGDQKKNEHPNYRYATYEVASECEIPGLLEISDILCCPISETATVDGLAHYQIKIPNPSSQVATKPDRNGYYFKGGIIGEIISLMSLCFRSSFFVLNLTSGKLNASGIPHRTNYPVSYYKLNPSFYQVYYENKDKNLASGLKLFLQKTRTLDYKLHQQFILSCYLYAQALREIGKDNDLAYVRLVSAIESLSSDIKLNRKEDPLTDKKFKDAINCLLLSSEEKGELEKLFETRKTRQKFIKFVKKYSKGYFKGGNFKAKNLKITKKQLPDMLKRIYNARSEYLHKGVPPYISDIYRGHEKYDVDSSIGIIIDRRHISASNKLPTIIFWEGLVRHCILNFLDDKDNQIKCS